MGLLHTLRSYRYHYKLYGKSGITLLNKIRNGAKGELIEMQLDGIAHPFYLRNQTSDLPTFNQIFFRKEYDIHQAPIANPSVIIDCGSNIGLAAIYFANKYPNAKIYSIEPEGSNFEMLKKNTEKYPNITPIHAAIWNKSGRLQIGDSGQGNWGFYTKEFTEGQTGDTTLGFADAISLNDIVEKFNITKIDLLKVDIEGAEKELFQDNYEKWLAMTKVLVIELHDHMKDGTSKSFFNAVSAYNYALYISGENLVCVFK
jgi:FkbM family methyltransferase